MDNDKLTGIAAIVFNKNRGLSGAILTALVLTAGCSNSSTSNLTSNPASQTPLYQATDWIGDGVFTEGVEGPAVDKDGNLYAVNYQRQGTIGVIHGKDSAELFLELPEGSIGNGIRFDDQNNMYIADYTGHNVLKVNMASKAVSVHAHQPDMHQPNDIAIAKNGVLYASDPDWQTNSGQLWKIDTSGKTMLLEKGMGTTNGVEVSTDEQHLYVNESAQRRIYVYDITANGNLQNKRLLIQFDDHGLDGMRCDSQGNLYVARYGAGVIAVVSPGGELTREIPLKGQYPTNVAFGGIDGRRVFVTMQKRGAIETFITDFPGRASSLASK